MKLLFSNYRLTPPEKAMRLVMGMYIIKVIAKIGVGTYMNSPLIQGDGFHNLADIFEAGIVWLMIRFAHRPASAEYPFGQRSREHILQLLVGVSLTITAAGILGKSLVGLGHSFPAIGTVLHTIRQALDMVYVGRLLPTITHEPLVFGTGYGGLALLLMLCSAIASFIVSRYQISVGRDHNSVGLVSDGQETRSDGYIELLICAGIISEYGFGLPWLEYIFGVAVSIKLIAVAWEIGSQGYVSFRNTLLTKSIGLEHESIIRNEVQAMSGVSGLSEIQTFIAGGVAIVILKIQSLATAKGSEYIKHAIAARLLPYLNENGFQQAKFFIRFEEPNENRHRIAVAIKRTRIRERCVSPTIAASDNLLICDVVHGRYARVERVTENFGTTVEERIMYFRRKRVVKVFVFTAKNDELEALQGVGITLATTTSYDLRNLGLS